MKYALTLLLAIFATGCTSSSTTTTTTTPTTELAGTWNVTGTGNTPTTTASGTFQVKLVSSACGTASTASCTGASASFTATH